MTRVRLSEPVAVGQIVIRVIERVQIRARPAGRTGAGLASMRPVAVLIQAGSTALAFDPSGEERSLAELARQYPELGLAAEG